MLDKITKLGISRREAEELIKVSKDINKDYELLLKGYPIQYLIGYVNFYGYKIFINKNVLIPRFETEGLVSKTIELLKKYNFYNINALDLCTGSGVIAVTLAKELEIPVTASDISEKALKVAKYNMDYHKINCNILKSDLFINIREKYNLIITNPPYVNKDENISEIVKKEPTIALFSDDKGTNHIKRILRDCQNHLEKNFLLAIEIGSEQGNELRAYATKMFPNSKIFIEQDLTNKDRYLFILKTNE